MKYLLFLLPIALFAFPNLCLSGSKAGLSLWANVLVPALFPYFTAANLLLITGTLQTPSRILKPLCRFARIPQTAADAAFCSILAGSPFAAGAVQQSLEKGEMQPQEGLRFLSFTACTGPVFTLYVLGTQFTGSVRIGAFCYLCHLLGTLCNLVLWRFGMQLFKKGTQAEPVKKEAVPLVKEALSFWEAFPKALSKSCETMLSIGTSVVFFSVLLQIGSEFIPAGANSQKGFYLGLMEITQGLKLMTSSMDKSALPLILFLLSFGGLCIYLQSVTLLKGQFAFLFFLQRITHGLCSGLLGYSLCIICPTGIENLLNPVTLLVFPVISQEVPLLSPLALGTLTFLGALCSLPRSIYLSRKRKK